MEYPFVYSPCVYWKMEEYRNVTPGIGPAIMPDRAYVLILRII